MLVLEDFLRKVRTELLLLLLRGEEVEREEREELAEEGEGGTSKACSMNRTHSLKYDCASSSEVSVMGIRSFSSSKCSAGCSSSKKGKSFVQLTTWVIPRMWYT